MPKITKLIRWLEATDKAWQQYLKDKKRIGLKNAYRHFYHSITK